MGPSSCVGISGNEQADAAAKEASSLGHSETVNIPHGDFKPMIHNFMYEKWQNYWSGLSTNAKLRNIKPLVRRWSSSCKLSRRSSIILTRLRIGHSHLTYRYLMASGEERQAPLCHTCHCILTIQHILVDCAGFSVQRRDNSLDGRSIQ